MSGDETVRLNNYGTVIARSAFLVILCALAVFMVPGCWERGGSELLIGVVMIIAPLGWAVLLLLTAVHITAGPRLRVRSILKSHDLDWAQVRSLSVRAVGTKAPGLTIAEHLMLSVETECGMWELKTNVQLLKRLREVMRVHGCERKLDDGMGRG